MKLIDYDTYNKHIVLTVHRHTKKLVVFLISTCIICNTRKWVTFKSKIVKLWNAINFEMLHRSLTYLLHHTTCDQNHYYFLLGAHKYPVLLDTQTRLLCFQLLHLLQYHLVHWQWFLTKNIYNNFYIIIYHSACIIK